MRNRRASPSRGPTVHYAKLPDWFLAFDVYARARRIFWSVPRRDELARRLDLELVPHVATRRFKFEEIIGLLRQSQLGDGPAEGLYLRRDERDRLVDRAKVCVRSSCKVSSSIGLIVR